MFPGLLQLIKDLKKEKYKLAVASGAHKEQLRSELARFKLRKYFDCVKSSEGMPSKPASDVFLFVAEELKVKPNECLVLEDAKVGVEAANTAGMRCFAIPNEFTLGQDFSLANKVLRNLKQVKKELVNLQKRIN